MGSFSVKAVMVLSTVSVMLSQITTSPAVNNPVTDPLSSVGKLSLEVCLITAVGVLWRALGAKDKALADERQLVLQLVEKVSAALERAGLGTIEARSDLEHLKASIEDMVRLHNKDKRVI